MAARLNGCCAIDARLLPQELNLYSLKLISNGASNDAEARTAWGQPICSKVCLNATGP